MPTWLIPALKSVLPHIGTIVSAAAPVFTKKNSSATANQTILLQQQITELQAAASKNDAHIKELATQIQNTVEVLERATSLAEKRHRWMMALGIAIVIVSALSLCIAIFILLYAEPGFSPPLTGK